MTCSALWQFQWGISVPGWEHFAGFLAVAEVGATNWKQSVFTHLMTVTFSLTTFISTFSSQVFAIVIEDQRNTWINSFWQQRAISGGLKVPFYAFLIKTAVLYSSYNFHIYCWFLTYWSSHHFNNFVERKKNIIHKKESWV